MTDEERTMRELRSEAVEDFVKAVYMLQQEHELVPTTLLAQTLDITPPSVTDMAKKLSDTERLHEPLLVVKPYRGVRLTPLGEQIALEVLRHHRLLELYLVEALGYSWDEVHEEADRLEHHISERFEARIAEVLGNPVIDPHGDPIPTLEGKLPGQEHLQPLADWPQDKPGVVVRFLDQAPEKLQYLEEKGLKPGAIIQITKREPFDGLTHVLIDSTLHVLSQSTTQSILIAEPR
ncbi:MAG: metal-dependent transcriptional regulator [Chloroflexi bacterium]|nr:metal-dependent transcriptional regulator [Chloroflexota bacterium]